MARQSEQFVIQIENAEVHCKGDVKRLGAYGRDTVLELELAGILQYRLHLIDDPGVALDDC